MYAISHFFCVKIINLMLQIHTFSVLLVKGGGKRCFSPDSYYR